MKTVTVGFSHSNNLFSKLIMFFTHSKISHTYIRMNDIVFQASGLSVNEMAYEYFLTYETVIEEFAVAVSDEQYDKGEAFRIATLGKPYSMKEVLGFAWVLLVKSITGKKVTNPGRDGKEAYVCVKSVAEYIGVDDSKENIDPDELYQMIKLLNRPAT